jgi:hypothetical protein
VNVVVAFTALASVNSDPVLIVPVPPFKAYDAVKANDAEVALAAFEANDADVAFSAYEADVANGIGSSKNLTESIKSALKSLKSAGVI